MERNPPDATGARVLIVEDDRAQLRTLVAILRDERFEVAGCATAREALDRFTRERFDVGIVDLGLPDTDNGHLLDRLADVASRVSLIVHTGRGSFDSAKKAVNIGAFAYVEKGGDPSELVRYVHRAVVTRLRRRAQDLEEERDRILALSQDLICVAAMDGYFKYVSPSWTRVLGYSAEELLSRPFLEFIHPDDHALNDAEVARLAQGIQTVDFENRYVCKHGSIRHFLWTATPLVEQGLMYCFGRDVTERKRAEESLARTTQRLTMALRSGNIGLWDCNFVTGEAHYSPELKAQLGYGENELENRVEEWESRLAPEDRARTLQALHDYLNGRRSEYAVEFRLRHKDGSYRWIYSRGEALRDTPGTARQMFGCHVDITDLKRAEEDAAQTAREWQSTFDATKDAVWILDVNHRILRANMSSEGFFSCSCAELVGRHCWEVMHGTAQPLAECPILRVRTSLQRETIELHVGERWLEVTVDPIVDARGQYAGAVHIISDVSGRKQVEQNLQASHTQLEQALAHARELAVRADSANRAKSEFLANMSHEIRTPMATTPGK